MVQFIYGTFYNQMENKYIFQTRKMASSNIYESLWIEPVFSSKKVILMLYLNTTIEEEYIRHIELVSQDNDNNFALSEMRHGRSLSKHSLFENKQQNITLKNDIIP